MARPRNCTLSQAIQRHALLHGPLCLARKSHARYWSEFWGPRKIRSITVPDLREWRVVRFRTHAVASVHAQQSYLSAVFRQAIEDGFLSTNPCRVLGFIEPENAKQRYFNAAEVAAILGAADEDLADHCRFAWRTGVRVGEQLALTWGDVFLPDGKIFVRRQKSKARWLPLHPEAQAVLERRRSLEVPFPSTYLQLWRAFGSAISKCGIRDASWHTWRHTFASDLVKAGISLYKVSKLLGHATVKMSERYSHLAQDDLQEAVLALGASHGREDRLTQQLETLTRQVAALGALVGREVLPG